VGAFAAGLVLDDAHFESFRDRGEHRLDELLQPVSALLVPIFFVSIGLKVDLSEFARPGLLGFASVLTLAAIIGKQACSLAVIERPINRTAIGLGMIPRGEVGLIFAGIGATLMLPKPQGVSEPVIAAASFGAVVIMVIITTLVTPPLLNWSLERATRRSEPPDHGIQETCDEHSATGEHPKSGI
jgi:Kef-type K+ transport system membrane component KefB